MIFIFLLFFYNSNDRISGIFTQQIFLLPHQHHYELVSIQVY